MQQFQSNCWSDLEEERRGWGSAQHLDRCAVSKAKGGAPALSALPLHPSPVATTVPSTLRRAVSLVEDRGHQGLQAWVLLPS